MLGGTRANDVIEKTAWGGEADLAWVEGQQVSRMVTWRQGAASVVNTWGPGRGRASADALRLRESEAGNRGPVTGKSEGRDGRSQLLEGLVGCGEFRFHFN